MPRTPKVHLAVTRARVACGADWRRSSTDPARVTCRGCARTLHMADAEAAIQHAPRQVYRITNPSRFSH